MKQIGITVLIGVVTAAAGCMTPGAKDTAPAPAADAVQAEMDALWAQQMPADEAGAPVRASAPERAPAPDGAAAGVMADMEAARDLNRQVAAELIRRGDALRDSADYAGAKTLYEEALARDPQSVEAREKLYLCERQLGERRASVAGFVQDWESDLSVERQARLNEVDRMIQSAVEAMADLRLEEARFLLEQGKARLAIMPASPDIDRRKEHLEKLLVDTKERLRSRAVETREQQEAAVRRSIEEDRRYREDLSRERTATLYTRAKEAYDGGDYGQCLQIVDAILRENPRHLQARALQINARKQEQTAWAHRLRETYEENMKLTWESLEDSAMPRADVFEFPHEDYWRGRVQQRDTTIQIGETPETEEIKEIKRRLETTSVTIDFDNKPLIDAVDYIKRITSINIHIDRDVDPEETKVHLSVTQKRLKDTLDLMMINTGLAYTFRSNVLLITVPEKALGEVGLRIYNVTDILTRVRDFQGPELEISTEEDGEGSAPGGAGFQFADVQEEEQMDPQQLTELITDSTGGSQVWRDPLSISAHRGQLLVEATPELHEKVEQVLKELRKDSDLFIVVRARFVDIFDDFLEDIGIDYRNLGQRGTPWRRTYSGRIHNARTGGQDPGFTGGLGVEDPELVGRMQHMFDGFASLIRGDRVSGGPGGLSGLTMQFMMVDPYQINAILRAVQEESGVKSVIAPEVTAHNGQQVFVSVITQRSYIADYELVSGGTTYTLTEVADPIVRVNEEGVVLDVRPTVSADRKYITIDVKPTLATLIGGVISTVLINLGTVMAAAMQVPIGLPKMSIQRTWTSVTVPDGGTVLLGGFRGMEEKKMRSTIPILGSIPLLNLLVSRQAELREKRSLVILLTAKLVDLRREETERFGM